MKSYLSANLKYYFLKECQIVSFIMAIEFIACYEASSHGILLQNFVIELRIMDNIKRPFKLFCDNKLTIMYSNNNKSSIKLKHINIKFLVVKKSVHSRQMSIKYNNINFMLVDLLTKRVPPKCFMSTAHMSVMSFEDIQF